MWPVLVEFRSANAESSWRKKKKEESVVKYKSADMYVGRPNNLWVAVRCHSKVYSLFTKVGTDAQLNVMLKIARRLFSEHVMSIKPAESGEWTWQPAVPERTFEQYPQSASISLISLPLLVAAAAAAAVVQLQLL